MENMSEEQYSRDLLNRVYWKCIDANDFVSAVFILRHIWCRVRYPH